MKALMLRLIMFSIVALLLVPISSADAVSVDIKATTSANQVDLFFTAGTYDITPIGVAGGGKYNAWNAWGYVSGCDENGGNCSKGWVNSYNIFSSEFDFRVGNPTLVYETNLLALSNAPSSSFTLTSDGNVSFYITDSYYSDNIGGISLDVTAAVVPEPISSTLFLIGGAILGFRKLRKRVS